MIKELEQLHYEEKLKRWGVSFQKRHTKGGDFIKVFIIIRCVERTFFLLPTYKKLGTLFNDIDG